MAKSTKKAESKALKDKKAVQPKGGFMGFIDAVVKDANSKTKKKP